MQATDNGRPQNSNQVRIIFTVIDRPVLSNHPPVFATLEPVARVMEDDPVGTMVMIIPTQDEDGDKVWYSIVGGCSVAGRSLLFLIGIGLKEYFISYVIGCQCGVKWDLLS